ncbi:MAG: protein kinase [Bacteroidales bacterium]
MSNSENIDTLKSYIIACCADGKISEQEYDYLKEESKRFRLSENKLKKEIHMALLNMGIERKAKKDFKSCVIYVKEALKYDPKSEKTLSILNEAFDLLTEDDLLDLAKSTIDGFEIYKEILLKKIKDKGNYYKSKPAEKKEDIEANIEKAVKFYTAATELSPQEQQSLTKLNEFLGYSGFVLVDEYSEGLTQSHTFQDVKLYKRGGMALIYSAILYDADSRWHERKIIIKQIRPEKKDQAIYEKLFFKEYNILRDLEHENILHVIRKGENENGQYYITEFINGKNLNELIEEHVGLTKKDGKRTRLLQILNELLQGIQGIHEESIIHRDIKPANIMITNSANKVKIIDFGLAKTDVYSDKLKEAGTRPYNSPEQRLHAYDADNRTDIYSFGIVMLEMITGWRELQTIDRLPERLTNLKRIIVKCTQDNPAARYNYISEIIEEFNKKEVIAEFAICAQQTIEEIEKEKATKKRQEPAKETIEQKPIAEKAKGRSGLILKVLAAVVLIAIIGFAAYKFIPFGADGVSPKYLSFESQIGDEKIVDINTSGEWQIQTDIDWLEIEEMHEEGENKLRIKTNVNNASFDERTGTIHVLFEDNKSKTINVAQLGLEADLLVNTDEIVLSNDLNESRSFEVKSNISWTVESQDEWIQLDVREGVNDGIVHIKASPNTGQKSRNGEIVLKGIEKDIQHTIVASQPGFLFLHIDPQAVSLSGAEGDTKNFTIESNVAWEVTGIPEWLDVKPTKGNTGETVTLSISNESLAREKVTLKIEARKEPELNKELVINIVANTPKWTFEELNTFVEKINGSSEIVNFDELYEFVDKSCNVYFLINNEKMSPENIETFINRVKFGTTDKVVKGSIKYNEQGKIIEFCQE